MADILQMLAELRAERDQLNEAILVVERLAAGSHTKRRGRPPKWMAAARAATGGAGIAHRRKFSPETRAKMAASQKKRWAARTKESKA